MSIAPAAASPHLPQPAPAGGSVDPSVRRVRHQARDAAALMAFSAATSVGVAVAFLLLALAARQA